MNILWIWNYDRGEPLCIYPGFGLNQAPIRVCKMDKLKYGTPPVDDIKNFLIYASSHTNSYEMTLKSILMMAYSASCGQEIWI